MTVTSADVRVIVDRVCARPDVLDACARRDLGAVVSALTDKRTGGLTQGQITELTGISQGRLSEWTTGKREPKGVSTFLKFADGLGLPPAARRALGLDSTSLPTVPGPRTTADLDVSYPGSPAGAMRNAPELRLTDQNDPTALQRGTADHRLWNDVSLRWLTDPGQMPGQPARGVRIGPSDVDRFRATVGMFARLDDRYGGGHAREALVRYLSTDAGRMLNGKYDDTVGRALFAAVSEGTLLAAFLSAEPVFA